jgi:NAD(P)-dependent dehydrogenase (short-subunit alcohol dehydrogenase family)
MNKMWVVGADMEGRSIGATIAKYAALRHQDDSLLDVNATSRSYVDVRHPAIVEAYVKTHGPFDDVVYAAGVNHLGSTSFLGALDYTDAFETFAVNVLGFITVLDALVQHQDQGNVVAVISDAAWTPMRGSIAYCASKAALVQAVRVAARELAPEWRVNGICPTVVDDTPMTDYTDSIVPQIRGWSPDQALAYERAMIPMNRRVFKSEVAELVLSVLWGPEMLTGAIIPITGGK